MRALSESYDLDIRVFAGEENEFKIEWEWRIIADGAARDADAHGFKRRGQFHGGRPTARSDGTFHNARHQNEPAR